MGQSSMGLRHHGSGLSKNEEVDAHLARHRTRAFSGTLSRSLGRYSFRDTLSFQIRDREGGAATPLGAASVHDKSVRVITNGAVMNPSPLSPNTRPGKPNSYPGALTYSVGGE